MISISSAPIAEMSLTHLTECLLRAQSAAPVSRKAFKRDNCPVYSDIGCNSSFYYLAVKISSASVISSWFSIGMVRVGSLLV